MTRPSWKAELSILTILVLAGAVSAAPGDPQTELFPLDAIGRLIADDSKVCTAFVIRSIERRGRGNFDHVKVVYENWIATAGHCAGQHTSFQLGSHRYDVRILGFSADGARGYDVLIGAFFTHLPVPTLEPGFGEYPQAGDKLMLIGYGQNALMMRVGPLLGYDDRGHLIINSYASPGNSGGPVLMPGTRRVVGIGIETTMDKPEGVSPIYCVLGSCAVKPPYIAAHIDRLMGLASFR